MCYQYYSYQQLPQQQQHHQQELQQYRLLYYYCYNYIFNNIMAANNKPYHNGTTVYKDISYYGFRSSKNYASRKYFRIIAIISLAAIITTFYLFGGMTTDGYYSLLRRLHDFSTDDKTTFFNYLNNSLSGKSPAGYIVWSPSCRIPDIPTLHSSIRKFVFPVKPIICNNNSPILTSVSQLSNGSHVLHLYRNLSAKYYKEPSPKCCYSLLIRNNTPGTEDKCGNADNNYVFGKCIDLKDNVTFTKDEEFIKVKCISKKKKEFYNNMHAFVIRKKSIENKLNQVTDKSDKKLNIMFIGIDSVSRLNFLRTMPKMANYLNKTGWFTLKGYNKIEDNTFPNLMAIFTGYMYDQLSKYCWKNRNDDMNNCPFIWSNYSDNGYVTCYAEDEPTIDTFHYHKKGFSKAPTDYYLRPFMLSAEKDLKIKSINNMNVCLGPRSTPDFILEYAVDFLKTFKNISTFSLFWLNSYSHNDLNNPSLIDKRMLKFFEDLEKIGTYNTTMVIFLSDHGMRFGKIRETYVGWLEERLPFIYIWLPQWFRQQYPKRIENLIKNNERLTSPFDVYVTLKDVIGLETDGPAGCVNCRSLFDEIPWNRTCIDAGITAHWCTCSEYKSLKLDSHPVMAIAGHVIKDLNKLLEEGSKNLINGTRCAKLKTKRILSVRSKVFTKNIGYEEYVILFQTLPGEALFEATVRHKYRFKIIDTVSRINTYGNQSHCMKDAFLQKYCYCEKLNA